jgi:heme A synthase
MPFIDVDIADAYETSALPGQGDVNAGGGGLDTSSMTNENVLDAFRLSPGARMRQHTSPGAGGSYIPGYTQGSGHSVRGDSAGNMYDASTGRKTGRALTPGLSGNPQADHPIWTIIIIIAILFIWKFAAKDDHEESKTVKVSLSNTVRITLQAALGFLILKWFFGVYSVASISPTVEFM